jgi:hypothetical protein
MVKEAIPKTIEREFKCYKCKQRFTEEIQVLDNDPRQGRPQHISLIGICMSCTRDIVKG